MKVNVKIAGASYNGVPSVSIPLQAGGTATFCEVSDTTATAADVATGKKFYTAAGELATGTNEQVNADWNENDADSKAFIKNKPDVLLKSGGMVTGTITASKFSGPLTGNVTGTADKATSDAAGNNIQNTYVKKTDLSSAVSTTSLTVSGETSVPTANEGNSSNTIASTEFVAKSLAKLVDSAPETMNTLNELAKALGNDPNFATTIVNELAKKLNSAEAESTYVKQGGVNLWKALHNNTTSNLNGLTNAQWNALGFFIRYFAGTTAFENQPSTYGQLINISAGDENSAEATQLFIEQNSGKLYFRGGNGSIAMKDVKFKQVAYWNDDKHLVFPNGAELWIE